MAFMKRESIRNHFYSDWITMLEHNIAIFDTRVHIFYAVKLGREYERRYRQHF